MALEVNQCQCRNEWRREVLEKRRRERMSLSEREVIENGELDEVQDVEKQYNDSEKQEDPDEKLRRNENCIQGPSTSEERKEEGDESKKLTNENEAATSWTTQEEEFQDHHKKCEEKKSTDDDEEAEHSMDEEADSDDEDEVKIYYKDDHHIDIFRNLAKFRDSSLLTDLTLSTEDRDSFHVHSPVLAAVSSHIREGLSRCNIGNDTVDERKDRRSVGVHRWSVSLGPEVDHVGLMAVVEFAYTGLISCLNKNTVHQIRAAAQTLGAPRVLDVCNEEGKKSTKTGEKKKKLSAAEQMITTLRSIKQLWMDRVGCDVILEALGGSLHVHRVILAVCSDYFRGMFTLGMRESHQPCVTLPFLLASELEVLIDSSYTGALPLSWKYVFEITCTALQLQYQPALSLCLNFLHQEINPHSCLDLASFAEAYEMGLLLEVADDYFLRQFQKVACTSKFKDLPAKQLLLYLNSRSLCVPSELVLFKAVVAWIQAKPKLRLTFAKELMKTIHFSLMTSKEFEEVQSLKIWSDPSLTKLHTAVFEDFCFNESQCRIYLPKESLVLIGGDQNSEDNRRISRELWFGNSLRQYKKGESDIEWRMLGEMPEPERFGHEVAVLKGQLYVFGGKKYYGISDSMNSVYSFMWPLDQPLGGHVANTSQGRIFVSGGLSSHHQFLSSMFIYHPENGSTYLANMAKPRACHCMESLDERLYVAGGFTAADDMSHTDQLACEVYDPVADSWTAFTPLPVPHVGAGGAVLEGKFYVLGGYSQENFRDTKMVHCYDPTTQSWQNKGTMPGPNNDIRACVLYLPPQFRL
ncbi:kelch-like protein 33 isoform X2 [Etheostoma spectabile]|uniref:kelch-like protein 33 isoform X2 n=1 Tax=Etheostoma spectabile TaxID=54343 RepID=UPI0013AEB17E|nr:kelch-like protein 33 isoform X2 [Etheostoma spectabile]